MQSTATGTQAVADVHDVTRVFERDVQLRARLRAFEFWVGHHQAGHPTPAIGPDAKTAPADTRDHRIGALVQLVPRLKELGAHDSPAVRASVSKCFSILAMAGRAPADREVWRMLLGLARYDSDATVRAAADAALADLERHGTVAMEFAQAS